MCHNIFNYFPTLGYLHCFQFFDILNETVIKIFKTCNTSDYFLKIYFYELNYYVKRESEMAKHHP